MNKKQKILTGIMLAILAWWTIGLADAGSDATPGLFGALGLIVATYAGVFFMLKSPKED